jgi:spermidine synthase
MHIPLFDSEVNESYFEEGVDGTSIVYKQRDKYWNYINGLLHGFWPSSGYYYQVVEVAGYTPKIDNVLVIGYGIGSITEAILKIDTLKNVTLIELNHSLIKNLKKIQFFEDQLGDRRLNLVIDDGRRFLLGTDKKYDLIVIDPLRSTTAYSNNLYSQQFFKLLNEHLNPNGVFMLWIDEYKVMPKTLLSVFPNVQIYDFFCLASNRPFKRNVQQRDRLFKNFSEKNQKAIQRWESREKKYTGDSYYIEKSLEHYPINQDWKPVAEYYIGLKVKEMFSEPAAKE